MWVPILASSPTSCGAIPSRFLLTSPTPIWRICSIGHSIEGLVRAALSAEPGQLTLKIPVYADVEEPGLASLSQDFADADRVRSIEFPVRPMDSEPLGAVGFVKIDVEQHEREVLEGAMDLIAAQKPNLLVEVSPLLYDQPLPTVFAPILALGYRGYFLFESRLVGFESFDPAVHTRRENLGDQHKFVGNVILSPDEL